MKKITKVLIILIIIIFFENENVSAKEIENTCTYIGQITQIKYDKKENIDVSITCKFYKEKSFGNHTYECNVSTAGKENIANWGSIMGSYRDFLKPEKWYSENKKCFEYFVYVDEGSTVSIYAADNLGTADALSSYISTKSANYDVGKIPLQGLEENYADQIDSYIDNLNKFGTKDDPWQLDECLDENGKLKKSAWNSKVCANRLNQYFDDVKDWKKEIKDAISEGKIAENDEKVKEFNEIVKNNEDKIDDDVESGFKDDSPFTEGVPDDEDDKTINVSPKDENACIYKDGIYYDANGDEVTEVEFNESCNLDCGIFGGNFGKLLKEVLAIIRFAVPVIIIGLSIVDFIKATTDQKDTEIKKAASRLVKRLIIGVIIFILPTLLEFVLYLADIPYGTCGIK